MAPKFGTSGLRGLVVELTDGLVRDHVTAFLTACPNGGAVFVGRDLRESSPRIAEVVREAVQARGLRAVDCGAVPTPALALASMNEGAAAIMVTGSHIPADRNGLKFYLPTGEISKADEAAILAALGQRADVAEPGIPAAMDAAGPYVQRYLGAYGRALDGLRVGVYQHSSVARDIMTEVFSGLGAVPVALSRSDSFVPVDTEALDPGTTALFDGWFAEHALDILVSTDGDADRPMVVDDRRRVVPGDVLGALTARALGAAVVCTPVSSNSMVSDAALGFEAVRRTKIGSPFVIAAMEAELANDPSVRVVGYEANGGFLLGFVADGPHGPLLPLMTRDCLLPMIAPLAAACAAGQKLSVQIDALPPRFTAADRLQGIDSAASRRFLAALRGDAALRAGFFSDLGPERSLDETDGLRLTFAEGAVVHLRPSGNAPEFRCYAEASSRETARALVAQTLARVGERLGAESG